MSRYGRYVVVIAGATLCGTMGSMAQAAPAVSIGGLTGAEHWVWQEGEDDFSAPNAGSAQFRDNTGVSGWTAEGLPNAYVRTSGSFNVRTVTWSFQAPATMSDQAQVFTRASINRDDVGMTMTLDSTVVADRMLASDQTNPTVFLQHKLNDVVLGQGVPVGALAAGGHSISYAAEAASVQGFTSFMVDGFLIYDGTPVLPTVPSTAGRRWLLNPSSADSPELAGPVTPVLNVTGLEAGHVVEYLLNGQAYTPGTEIGPGAYELVIAVWQDSAATSERLAFAGANFTIIPEPTSLLLLAGGAIAIFSRRKTQAG